MLCKKHGGVPLLLLLALCGHCVVSVLAGQIRCGDAAGQHCSNAFNDIYCDSHGGACCYDDFNGWCCPPHYSCSGPYSDPGGNTHCMTPSKVSGSCLCTQTQFSIISMVPTGPVKVDKAFDDHLQACCEGAHVDKCGWTTSITMTNSETVSWSDTVDVGFTLDFEAGVPGDMAKYGFQFKNSFTTGQSTATSTSQTYTSSCTCTGTKCFTPWTHLTFQLQYAEVTQPMQLTVQKCGTQKVISGSASVKQFQAFSICDPGTHGYPDRASCERALPLIRNATMPFKNTSRT